MPREKWRIALAEVRRVQPAGFTITGVVVDADYSELHAACQKHLTPSGPLHCI